MGGAAHPKHLRSRLIDKVPAPAALAFSDAEIPTTCECPAADERFLFLCQPDEIPCCGSELRIRHAGELLGPIAILQGDLRGGCHEEILRGSI